MTLKLKFTKDAVPFIDFLTAFKKIGDTLLLEVDVENQKFSAKSSSGTTCIESTRYSELPFESCGVEIVNKQGEELPNRVYVGILNRVGKLISIVTEANRRVLPHDDATFLLSIDYTEYAMRDIHNNTLNIYGAVSLLIKTSKLPGNKGLSTTMGCYVLSNGAMQVITDQQFEDDIFYLDPDSKYSFPVDQDSLESIFKMMEIYKTTGSKDNEVVINISDNKICFSNETIEGQKVSESFSEVIYEGDINDIYANQSVRVSKDAFRKNVNKKLDIVLSIGIASSGELDRLCIEETDQLTNEASKIVLLRNMNTNL